MPKKKIIFLSILVLIIVLFISFLIWKFFYIKNNSEKIRDAKIIKELKSFPRMTKESLSPEHPLYNEVKTEKEIIENLKSL